MFGLDGDEERARRIGRKMRALREQRGLTLGDVARATGVSTGTIKRFEEFALAGTNEKPFRYEPWGAEYLERWIDGTMTPQIRMKHDLQRILERDPGLSRKQVKEILPQLYEIYERVREGKAK